MGESTGRSEQAAERLRGQRVVKPIVYGNTAVSFGQKRESDSHTHQWTVFVRPYFNEDCSLYIRKVQFKLHDSYAIPYRVVEKPPFEVTESGWGEFEIQIRIYFADINEKPVTAFHYLRLFAPAHVGPDGVTTVACEYYDEIVFQEPTAAFYKTLMAAEESRKKTEPKRFKSDLIAKQKETLQAVLDANDMIKKELEDLRCSLLEAHKLALKHQPILDNIEAAAINSVLAAKSAAKAAKEEETTKQEEPTDSSNSSTVG